MDDDVRAVLLDIDGVLTVSWEPVPGAVEAVRTLRDAGLPLVLLTNTSSRTRARIAERLADAGFPVGPDDVLTAAAATSAHLREHHPHARCLLLNSGDVADDLEGVTLVGPDDEPDVVVLGGAGPEFTYEALNGVFAHLQRGAALVAFHRNLYWRTDEGLSLDAGALLLGLERAADVEATMCWRTMSRRLAPSARRRPVRGAAFRNFASSRPTTFTRHTARNSSAMPISTRLSFCTTSLRSSHCPTS